MSFSFGGQQASQASGGFSFASTPASSSLFGGATPGFGASSAAATFSNPFAASSQLGKTTSTPAFGGGFGATPASTPSIFGAASSSTFGTSTPNPFAIVPAAASSSSLFGSQSTPAFGQPSSIPAFGGFGGFGASSASSSQPGLFGTMQPGQQGAFGSTQTQMAPAGFASGLPAQPDFSAIKELEAVASAYNTASPRFRFHHLFLNVVDNTAARVKPQDMDELQWREALQRAGGPDNPDRLWPVPAKGFKDLIARKNAQDEALKEHASRLEAAEQAARQLARRQESFVRERIEAVRRKHLELSHVLLRIMRMVDALEGRFAASQGYWDAHSAEAASQLARALDSLEAAIAPAAAGGLQRRVEALAAAARLRGGAPGEEAPRLDDASLASVFAVLRQQGEALERLQDVLRRDNRDIALLLESS